MKAYLERAQEHDKFMKTQKHEFEIGKRHLANMMGEAAEAYEDQAQIDVSLVVQFLDSFNNEFFNTSGSDPLSISICTLRANCSTNDEATRGSFSTTQSGRVR